jgi:CheY-like chemotaxis protein
MRSGEEIEARHMATRILIVEDDHESRWVLANMLRLMGYETIEAETAEQALEKAVSEGPQLILMDLGLPQMSGVDATRALKQNRTSARIPVIGQSACDHKLWKKAAVDAGMVEYIQKPFGAETLKAAIERCLISTSDDHDGP